MTYVIELKEGPIRLLHDPLTVAVVKHPDIVQTEKLQVNVETEGTYTAGASVAELRPSQAGKNLNTTVCLGLDKQSFLGDFIHTIASN